MRRSRSLENRGQVTSLSAACNWSWLDARFAERTNVVSGKVVACVVATAAKRLVSGAGGARSLLRTSLCYKQGFLQAKTAFPHVESSENDGQGPVLAGFNKIVGAGVNDLNREA